MALQDPQIQIIQKHILSDDGGFDAYLQEEGISHIDVMSELDIEYVSLLLTRRPQLVFEANADGQRAIDLLGDREKLIRAHDPHFELLQLVESGWTPLMFAMHRGQVELAKQLTSKSDLTATTIQGNLFYCMMVISPDEHREALIENFFKDDAVTHDFVRQIIAQDTLHRTPIHMMAGLHPITDTMLRNMVSQGIDLNAIDTLGRTALDIAMQGGNTDNIALLKQHGAVSGSDKVSSNRSFHKSVMSMKSSVTDAHLAGTHGKRQINQLDSSGRTPLDCAIQAGHLKNYKTLKSYGAQRGTISIENLLTMSTNKEQTSLIIKAEGLSQLMQEKGHTVGKWYDTQRSSKGLFTNLFHWKSSERGTQISVFVKVPI